MIKYKNSILLLFLFFSFFTAKSEVIIEEIVVRCDKSKGCSHFEEKLNELKGSYEKLEDLDFYLNSDGIEKSHYKVVEDKKIVFDLYFRLEVKSIEFKTKKGTSFKEIESSLYLQEGDFYTVEKAKDSTLLLYRYLEDLGHANSSVNFETKEDEGELEIVYFIDEGPRDIIADFSIQINQEGVSSLFHRKIKEILGRPLDKMALKETIRSIKEFAHQLGFYKINLNYNVVESVSHEKKIIFKIDLGEQYFFNFKGNKHFSSRELIEKIKERVLLEENAVEMTTIKDWILAFYAEEGHFFNRIKSIDLSFQRRPFNPLLRHYFFNIKEGRKLSLGPIDILGNEFLSDKEIRSFFVSEVDNREAYDKKSAENFPRKLQEYYMAKGYLFTKVTGPKLLLKKGKRPKIKLSYFVEEGEQTKVRAFTLKSKKGEIFSLGELKLSNKEDGPFNPISFEKDLKKIEQHYRAKGHLNFSFTKPVEEMISFHEANREVEIHLEVDLNEIYRLRSIFISGNEKTKNSVLRREISYKQGEVINDEMLLKIKEQFYSLGIFSQIKIDAFKRRQVASKQEIESDLLIEVKEKRPGVLELAPGYRSDLGPKISASLLYLNILGRAQSVGVKIDLNQRTDSSSLQSQRPLSREKKMEFNFRTNYSGPRFLGLPWKYQLQYSSYFKRYYAFDAQVNRISFDINKWFFDRLNVQLGHQLESISQKNSFEDRLNGRFRIGSLTPALEFSLVDSTIRPSKGASFALSVEFANPYWGSQKADPMINYYTLVSRNKFYFPIPYGVLFFSVSMGLQKNLTAGTEQQATIPSIKVFRLAGTDLVRGFRDDEINAIEQRTGKVDISDTDIRNKAYFINYRLGPRFYLSDDSMLGPFLDAGRVFIDHFQPLKTRLSVGLGVRYLTPVGPLDFDYGFKLHRERRIDGNRERFGQFHISIGIF